MKRFAFLSFTALCLTHCQKTPRDHNGFVRHPLEGGVTVSVQASADTYLSQNRPSTANGSATTVRVDGDDPSNGQDLVGLLRFDVSSIPARSTVQSATLSLRVTNATPEPYSLFAAKRAWNEAQASWARAATGVTWEVAGASGSSDRGNMSLGAFVGSSTGTRTFTLNADGVALVQSWVNNPAANFGFIFADSVSTDGLAFSSREASASSRPQLTLTYQPPSAPVPDAGGPVVPPEPTPSVLVAQGSSWRYFDKGTDLGTGWRAPAFDDSGWAVGAAELGYGDGDETTTVSFGSNASAKYVTTYFRKAFSVPSPQAYASLTLRLKRDDGAIVYLNGTEVFRTNLPTGTVTASTLATNADDEGLFLVQTISPSLLSTQNVLAVEVHQTNRSSSDLSFDLGLTGTVPGEIPDAGSSGDAAVLVGAGDIADCAETGDTLTANLLDSIPGTIFLAGDNAYESGTLSEYQNCFHPTWGRHKARIRPSPGNHEYQTSNAAGYYAYFGAAAGDPNKGYYSYELGDWHIVVLNSNCSEIGGCESGSAQETWLRSDLAAHPKRCTLAYWHHPRYSSGEHGNDSDVADLWKALQDHSAELVLTGHDHNYERFTAMNANGAADPNGLVQFVVGTGGRHLRPFTRPKPSTSVVRNADSFGVLKLTLRSDRYDWQFIPASGSSFTDTGSGLCR